jgi:UDP-3-O-[3-hydroxymyristoyl] glucosamine N-acyltransferase
MLIPQIVAKIDHIEVYGDIMDFLDVDIQPQEIHYEGNILNIGGFSLKVENGRYAFAQALDCFKAPVMIVTNYNSVCENTKFDGPINIGQFNTIGGPGFGYEKGLHIKHLGNVVLGNGVVIHNHVNIDRGVLKSTVIGDGNKIDSLTHIAHQAILGANNTLAAHTIIEGSCVIGENNTFGTGVIVQRKVKVGNNNVFGSGCVVTKDVGDNGVWVGVPARKIN